ncbi:MAG: Delta-1-pyrroline-5-carboxylate dehydrogenase, mitochondrial [Heterodermia speciosa]|uniref:Multifunctional fusion protein n=1 Tax=Heterodermia speciosa TaxID=116794 RepID=A0A8H3ETW3_9LECA|nr:MAG: Delta-1-pyrroline-5-carboxylate dehydrogenase, mitochondrial [Heterodermia speciosa]
MKQLTTMWGSAISRSPLVQPTARVPTLVDRARRGIATGGHYVVPKPFNEPNFHYFKGSPERQKLITALKDLRSQLPVQVPARGGPTSSQAQKNAQPVSMPMPSEHGTVFAQYADASGSDVSDAIESALTAKLAWQDMPFTDRAAIFLRAAELVSGKYRYELMAATMLGQGKNAWQAEIDAAAELADFFRFNVGFAQEIYDKQPTINSHGHHGRTDWRPLEGFVYAISPFNFTAIGGNLISAPALMGNVVVWKPSPMSVYPSYLVHKILLEAGLPPGVIQLINGDPEVVTQKVFEHREFSALSFIGSSSVFRSLYSKAAEGVVSNRYRDLPRMVGETSGKNFHLVHPSADIENAAKHTIRASFEYSGQKCSACSRIYIPQSQASAFLDVMKRELNAVKVGPPEDFENFLGPVINQAAFDKITKAIDSANKDDQLVRVTGGTYDGSKGLFIDPTLYVSKTPDHPLFEQELFGPVLVAHIYPDAEFDDVLGVIDRQGGNFALTGAIFSNDQAAVRKAENRLRYAAGNFYVNCKTTGAVIGQQSFGGSRSSGTCDKAGSVNLLMRFTAPRTLKEEYNKLENVMYPSNL